MVLSSYTLKITSKLGLKLYEILKYFLKEQHDSSITTSTIKKFVCQSKTKKDLKWQKEILYEKYPSCKLVSNIGSVKRKCLQTQTLLERSCQGMVREVVVTHHERLCRFAYELLKHVFSLHSTKLMVLFDDSATNEHELSEDILATNTVFTYRMPGTKHRRERKEKKENIYSEKKQEKKTGRSREQNVESEIVSESCTETLIEAMDGIGEINL